MESKLYAVFGRCRRNGDQTKITGVSSASYGNLASGAKANLALLGKIFTFFGSQKPAVLAEKRVAHP
jgi:hypothetical protein